jgi:hypothetical protein
VYELAQDVAHVEPVNPEGSLHEFPHDVTVIIVPLPQHTGVPASRAAQSIAPRHCQSVDMATGHVVAAGWQVDGVLAEYGVSQQCSPAAHVCAFPPSTPL